MNLSMLVKGIILGFSIAAPVGPLGVLCIERTLTFGRRAGLYTGVGVATADTLYGCIAAFGLTSISDLLVGHQSLIRLCGGFFLAYLGIKILLSKSDLANKANGKSEDTTLGHFSSAFILTVTNPMTILSFVAAFAGLGLGVSSDRNVLDGGLMVFGVFSGSVFWWLLLSSIVSTLRKKVSPAVLLWINRGSGLIICIFAGTALFGAFR